MMDAEKFGAQIGTFVKAAIQREVAAIRLDLSDKVAGLQMELERVKALPQPVAVSVKSGQILQDGTLSLVLTDGATVNVGNVVGPKGDKGDPGETIKGDKGDKGDAGTDGSDGLGFEDLDIEAADERHFKIVARRGEKAVERVFRVPALIYRGIHKEGEAYEPGDVVTFGGSMWVAKADTKEKPKDGADWQLSVKKGRDGRDFEVRDDPKGVKL
jgi:integrin beta 3